MNDLNEFKIVSILVIIGKWIFAQMAKSYSTNVTGWEK